MAIGQGAQHLLGYTRRFFHPSRISAFSVSAPSLPAMRQFASLLFIAAFAFALALAACDDDPASPEPDDPEPEFTNVEVTGTVTDAESEAPIEGAAVAAYLDDEGEPAGEDETAEGGTYEISFEVEEGEEPSTLRIEADADGYAPGEGATEFAPSVTEDVELEPAEVEATASGTVTGSESGEPIEAATVTGETEAGDALFETETDSEGDYSAELAVTDAPNALTITADADGYERESATADFADEMEVDFELDPATTEATASGTVSDAESGEAIDGATVAGADAESGDELFETTTATDGSYEASIEVADEPDELTITADADGYEAESRAVAFSEEMTTDFELEPIDTSVEATISGTVTDADSGDPVEGATVTGTLGGSELFSATTDAGGAYEATFTVEEEPDELTVTATADSYEDAEQTIAFAEEMTADLELQPILGEFTIEATIQNTDGEPVEGVEVAAEQLELSGTTGSQGEVTLTYTEDPALEELTLTHEDPEGLYEEKSVTQPANEDVSYVATLEDVLVEVTATGTVTSDDGEALAGASVTYVSEEVGIDAETETDSDGTYDLALGEVAKRLLGVAAVEAEASKENFASDTATPTLAETIQQDFTLESLLQAITFDITTRVIGSEDQGANQVYVEVEGQQRQTYNLPATITIQAQPNDEVQIGVPDDEKINANVSQVFLLYKSNPSGPKIDHTPIANNQLVEDWTPGDPYTPTTVQASQLNAQDLEGRLATYEHTSDGNTYFLNESSVVSDFWGRSGWQSVTWSSFEDVDHLRVLIQEYEVNNPDYKIDEKVLETTEDAANTLFGGHLPFPYEIKRISSPEEMEPYEDDDFKNTMIVQYLFTSSPSNGSNFDSNTGIMNYGFLDIPVSGRGKAVEMIELTEATAAYDDANTLNEEGTDLNTLSSTKYQLRLKMKSGTAVDR